MGIYDRDYYRRERPYLLGTWTRAGQVCKWLVLINVGVYVVQLLTFKSTDHYGFFTDALAMKPDLVFSSFPEVWRLLTGVFLHSPNLHSPNDWTHILWNMLFLWFFGPDLEEVYGHREFLGFYLVAGIIGNLFWGLTTLWQTVPVHLSTGQAIYPMALGASGAVTAVLVLATFHWPHRTILLMFVIPVPLWLITIIHVGGDLFYFLRGSLGTGVAVAAHLGGAGFALLYFKMNWRILGTWANFTALMRRRGQPRLRVYREEPRAPVRRQPANPRDEQLEAKADAVLEKVASKGMDSLSAEEKEILQRASEQYKKKRT